MVTKLQIERAYLLLPHLVDHARKGQTVTYKEIGDEIGVFHRGFFPALGYIRDEFCAKRGYPLINALVVSKSTQLPGESWLPSSVGELTPTQNRLRHDLEKEKIFSFKRWDDLLTDVGF
ncbi:MAG: hypothetical protein RBT65_00915 [Methanolobus sp.]|jgi:hypothetical protein|nr:hypothetical protein [Methanolobus sp.]